MTAATCRLLTLEDTDALRQIRLRACKEEPVAFAEEYEDLLELKPEEFQKYFDNGWIAGAFVAENLVAIAGLYGNKMRKIAHKGNIWGVYVTPEMRGAGLSRQLITLLLSEAEKSDLEIIHLSTDADNQVTVSLYKSLGFEAWGIDTEFAKVSGRYVNEIMMKKYLKAAKP